jgi:hypothetical protein
MKCHAVRLDGENLRLRPIEARWEALARLAAGTSRRREVDGIVFSEALAATRCSPE